MKRTVSLSLVIGLLSSVSGSANALTVESSCGGGEDPTNPASLSISACPVDGGTFGPLIVNAEASSSFTEIKPSFSLSNPSGNVMGDDEDLFFEAHHTTLFSTLSFFTMGRNISLWRVRLEEAGASLTLQAQAFQNQQLVNGVTRTFVFDEAAGCEIGQICQLPNDPQRFNVNFGGVNELGFRWTLLADGAQSVNLVVPEPTTALLVAGGLAGLVTRRRRH